MNRFLRVAVPMLLSIGWIPIAYAQLLPSRSDGSLVVKNASLGVGISDAKVDLSLTNYTGMEIAGRCQFLYGVQASAKNKDGVSELVSKGVWNNESKGQFLFGFTFRPKIYRFDMVEAGATNEEALRRTVNARLGLESQQAENVLRRDLYALIQREFANFRLQIRGNTNASRDSVVQFYQRVDSSKNDYVGDVLKKAESLSTDQDAEIAAFGRSIRSFRAAEVYKRYVALVDRADAEFDRRIAYYKALASSRRVKGLGRSIFKMYVTGGLTGTSNDFYRGNDTNTIANKFVTKDFAGTNLGLGVNYSFRQFSFGALWKHEWGNNVSDLSAKHYTYEVVDTASGKSTITHTKERDAYLAADYKGIEFDRFYLDATGYILMPDMDSTSLVLGLYYRGNRSNNVSISASSQDIGLYSALFSYKGKFQGGLYLELTDMWNQKAGDDTDLRARMGYQRLSLGLYTRFYLTSLAKAF